MSPQTSSEAAFWSFPLSVLTSESLQVSLVLLVLLALLGALVTAARMSPI